MLENCLLICWVISGICVFVITGPVVSLLFFLLYVCIGSMLLMLYGMDYIAFLLLVVYAGAVIVLFLFLTMFLSIRMFEIFEYRFKYSTLTYFILGFLFVFLFFVTGLPTITYSMSYVGLDYMTVLNFSIHFLHKLGFYIFLENPTTFFFLGMLLYIGMEGVLYLVMDYLKFNYVKVKWYHDL